MYYMSLLYLNLKELLPFFQQLLMWAIQGMMALLFLKTSHFCCKISHLKNTGNFGEKFAILCSDASYTPNLKQRFLGEKVYTVDST